MMNHSLFTSQMAGSLESHADLALARIAEMLKGMRASFYDMDRSEIRQNNLSLLEKELRGIIKEIDTSPVIKNSINSKCITTSADGILCELGQVRNKLYLAMHILNRLEQRFNLKLHEQLYLYYDEICVHLGVTIEHLQETQ
jgi:hypothetical protein